ncbi:hypothetical protein Pcinc_031975 [Petrolisthes cinctipes]|uniref:Bardet-Biedl syndrome 1 N-terminal domain-containing protein n=1 Tax=Petrolisthes cinctipes TaxID=88211 RepID=A0AAE1EVH7_PETCI|nr:hypothetical protein Pcinc_031975 [Petrolisthes cinctipes]
MGEKSNSSERWLTAHHDPLASLYTFGSCMALADLHGDGDSKLIIADLGTGAYNMKLKVYKGTNLMSENTLIDLPTGVITFHMDTTEPRVPGLYARTSVLTSQLCLPQARDELLDVSMLYEILDSLRQEVGECGLTTRSQRFLMCHDHASQLTFLEQHKGFLLKRQTVVTCFSTLKKSHAEDDAISCLVLGTESANIFILDPEAFTILNSVSGVNMTLDQPGRECETAVSKSTEKTTQENSPETLIERWPTSSETQEPLPSSPSRSNPPPGALHQIIQQSTANT